MSPELTSELALALTSSTSRLDVRTSHPVIAGRAGDALVVLSRPPFHPDVDLRVCGECGGSLTGRDPRTRTCSGRCRNTLNTRRRRRRARLSMNRAELQQRAAEYYAQTIKRSGSASDVDLVAVALEGLPDAQLAAVLTILQESPETTDREDAMHRRKLYGIGSVDYRAAPGRSTLGRIRTSCGASRMRPRACSLGDRSGPSVPKCGDRCRMGRTATPKEGPRWA